MNSIIKADLFRYGRQTNLFLGFKEPGFRYLYFLRKASKKRTYSIIGIFYKIILRHLGYKYGFQIPKNTKIGKGFFIGHFGTIVINEAAKIGDNCNIAHSTTIGQASRGKLKGAPSIGNNVWIGTGSVIIGKITIGNNVLIAPNTFLNKNVPDNSLVIGNPCKIIDKVNATHGYINNIYENTL